MTTAFGKTLTVAALAVGAFLAATSPANAAVVELTWTTPTAVTGFNKVPGSVLGESYTTTFRVDNGGSSLASQVWTTSNFLSFRQEGASGWSIESTTIVSFASSGSFSTDAAGLVTTAGNWSAFAGGVVLQTSWAGDQAGGWFNNGFNNTSCTNVALICVSATNVGNNIIGSSWTAALADDPGTQVPEPGSLALLGLSLASLAAIRKRKQA